MNLDLQHFASTRQKIADKQHNLSYLLGPVRAELAQRFDELRPEIASDGLDILILDFQPEQIHITAGHAHYAVQNLAMLDQTGKPGCALEAIAPRRFDAIVDNLNLSWMESNHHIQQMFGLLKPGGVYLFSCFGPDTLYEVAEAWRRIDSAPHIHDAIDMHHLGDQLLQAGFTKPIVDADWWLIDYPDAETLFLDIKAEGFANIHCRRRKSLTGKNRFAAFQKNLTAPGEALAITFEIVYGFGKKPLAASAAQIRVAPPEFGKPL